MFKKTMLLTVLSISRGNTQSVMSNSMQQTIYYGGDIITMDGDTPNYAEAVVENNIPQSGWIVGWGYDQELLKEKRHIKKTG